MTQILADAITDLDNGFDEKFRQWLYVHYGTTSRTVLTMFQITLAPGAWGVVGRPVIEMNPLFAWFYIAYVGGVSFAVIRVITTLFLRQTIQVATGDDQVQRTEKQ